MPGIVVIHCVAKNQGPGHKYHVLTMSEIDSYVDVSSSRERIKLN